MALLGSDILTRTWYRGRVVDWEYNGIDSPSSVRILYVCFCHPAHPLFLLLPGKSVNECGLSTFLTCVYRPVDASREDFRF